MEREKGQGQQLRILKTCGERGQPRKTPFSRNDKEIGADVRYLSRLDCNVFHSSSRSESQRSRTMEELKEYKVPILDCISMIKKDTEVIAVYFSLV